MTFTPHWRLVLGGNIGGVGAGGPEIWQCNINMIGVVAGNENDYLTVVNDPIGDWFEDAISNMRSDATLAYLKFNQIGADGKYVDPVTTHVFDYSPARVGAGTASVPYILTACISWQTARNRGLGARGRIYPPVAIGLEAPGQMTLSVASQGALLATGGRLLSAITPATFPDIVPVIASNGSKSAPGVAGPNVPINHVSVGSVIDVQRRRKDQLVETYVGANWP